VNKLHVLIILIALSVFWYGFGGESITATTGSETSFDMPSTNFTGADLTESNLAE